ncbi:MAG: PEP-CTERM sorting domain-containing protein [Rubrivivax sp.]|nr:PEP-CTERM sorting domain-containing protein [Rubrivivax sp.]
MNGSTVGSRRFAGLFSRTAVAGAIGAGLMLGASTAFAQIVHSGVVSLAIPVSTNGLYLNVVTGANNLPPPGTGGSTVPGWDINLWSTGGLGFFNAASPAGGVYVISGAGTVGNLALGSTIDGSSSFGAGTSTNVAQWNLNSANNLFGFRFVNEANGNSLHYGWGRISLGATANDPSRLLVEYAFDATPGAAIQAGVIPEPGTFALLGLGVAGVLLAARRRRET